VLIFCRQSDKKNNKKKKTEKVKNVHKDAQGLRKFTSQNQEFQRAG